MHEVDFYYGLGSRYSYLAFTQLEGIERRRQCSFRLHPISSVELMQMHGRSPFEGQPVSGQYDWSYRRCDAEAWAALYGVPFVEPAELPGDHRLMARACHAAAAQHALRDYSAALFGAVFVRHETVDAQQCVALAASIKLDTRRFAADLECDRIASDVTAAARAAFERGAFGVPTCFVGDQMFWGNDRLVLLEHWLGRQAA